MNGYKAFIFLLTIVVLAGCTPRPVYLQNEYTGFMRELDTTRGSTIEIAGETYRVVRPRKDALVAQDLLVSLRIKEASFQNTTVSDALVILDRIQKEDNQGITVPIVFEELPGETYRVKRLTFRIQDATLIEVLRIICAETDLTLGMREGAAVLFYGTEFFRDQPMGAGDAEEE